MEIGAAIMEHSMEVSQIIKNGMTILLNNPTSGYVIEQNYITVMKRYLHPRVHGRITDNSQIVEEPKWPWADDWIKKICVCVMGYHLAVKRRKSCICDNMDELWMFHK